MPEAQHCHNEFLPLDCKIEESVFFRSLIKNISFFLVFIKWANGFRGKQWVCLTTILKITVKLYGTKWCHQYIIEHSI